MTAPPRPPFLGRVPLGVWVAAFWSAFILLRTFQRPGELHLLFDYDGNIEDAPLLVTAVVTTLSALLVFRAPLAAVVVALAGVTVSLGMAERATPVVLFFLADGLVGYTVATRPRRASVLAAVLPVGIVTGYTIWHLVDRFPVNVSMSLTLASTAAVAWLVGNTIRQRRAHADALRLQATQEAVTAERLRVAREVHDMVAHNVGIIAIQAGMGSRVLDAQPEQARNALSAVEAASRETLAGLRRMLGALRQADSAPAPLTPSQGLVALDHLVATTEDAGVRVDVRRRGEPRELPAEVDLAAFRIIQEAVTNVVRHSGTRDCSVTVDYRHDDEFAVEIIDLGCGGTPEPSGYGIAGMKERVSLLHGRFSAGPRPEGGFRVAARLPSREESRK